MNGERHIGGEEDTSHTPHGNVAAEGDAMLATGDDGLPPKHKGAQDGHERRRKPSYWLY